MPSFWDTFFYLTNRLTPARSLTRFCGRIADCEWAPLKNFLIQSFIKYYAINMTEAESIDLNTYKSFNAFFTRKLNPDSFFVDKTPNALVSPAQGIISRLYQLGESFYCESKNLSLRGDLLVSTQFLNGSDLVRVLYLSPADYHRVHAPCDGVVINIQRHEGRLLSVAPRLLKIHPTLLQENDRVTITLKTDFGFVNVVLVGAMIVGSIQLKEEKLPYKVERGDELGYFKLGSTVIILTPPLVEFYTDEGKVQMGSRLGHFKKES
ncbi:phosphatidylserine decarboxylase [bacterium]|jgi:phosphatidylserine decarboxylase|nr:phosphatidylserine decarboxylase [bacterium]NBW56688.1 phosphatidylserine decarboxylase [bacterium]NBX72179.1 phosphatidylserine decarboxylase [bacterium]